MDHFAFQSILADKDTLWKRTCIKISFYDLAIKDGMFKIVYC